MVLLLGCLSLAACSSTRTVLVLPSAGFPNHSAAEVIARLPGPDSLWSSFEADLAVAYSTPDESGSVNVRVAHRRADSTLIRFRAPLGIEFSRALLTSDSTFIYDRVDRKLYFGDRQAAQTALPFAFPDGDMAASLFGYQVPNGDGWSIRADSNLYLLTSKDGRRTIRVDPGRWRIVAIDDVSRSGMIVEQRRFTDFERIEGRYLPQRIVTSRPGDQLRASFTLRRLRPAPRNLSFELGLRNDIQRIPLY